MPANTHGLLGCILAGGLSSRMGQDKALLWHNGTTLLERIYAVVCEIVPSVVVTRDRLYEGCPCLVEQGERTGPIGGIVRGLEEADRRNLRGILVVACDMPFIQTNTLQTLLDAEQDAPGALEILFCRRMVGGQQGKHDVFEQNLAAIYRLQCLPFLKDAIKQKKYSLRKCIPDEYKKRIWYTIEEEKNFLNVNTPQEYAEIHQETTDF